MGSDYEPFPLDPASVGCERLAERVRELEALVGRLAERNGQLSQLLTRYASGEHVDALRPFAAVSLPDNWPGDAPLMWEQATSRIDGEPYLYALHGRVGTGGVPVEAYRRARRLIHGLPRPEPVYPDDDGEVD